MKTDLILQRSTFFSINSSSTIINRLSTGSISLVWKTIFLVCIGLLGFNSWGQIAQRGSSTTATNAATNNTTITINKPSGVVAGDVLLFSVVQNETDNDNGGLASPTLSGWTLVRDREIRSEGTNNNDNQWFGSVYYRIADGSEGSSFSLTMHSRCDMAIGSMVAFSSVACNALRPDGSAGGPFDIAPGVFNNANSSTAAATEVSIANNNSAVIMFVMVNNDRSFSSWSNSQTELFDNITTDGDDASVGAAWLSSVNSGATGSRTVTLSSSDRNSAILLVLRKADSYTAGVASSTPTLCVNTALTNITHTTVGATGIGTAIGLPTGVSASWASNTITISGTPTVSGTFSYSIPLTGGCFTVNATGTITVLPIPTSVSATSSSSTICIGNSTDLTCSASFNNPSSTIAFNGFETGNSWSFTNTNGSTKSGSSASGDRPATSSFFNSGSTSFWSNNASAVVTTSNFTGLSAYTNKYFQFDLASFSIGSTTNGVDATDVVTVAVSLDGGTTYSNEITIAGNTNAYWSFTSGTGTAEITYDGNNSATAFAPSGGGNRTTDGYGLVKLNLPNNATQFRVKLTLLNNASSEAWVIDDLTLFGTPNATYSWSSNPVGFTSIDQNPSVTPTETTIYTISATNSFGCSASASTTITVNQPSSSITVNGVTIGEGDYLWNGKLNSNANVKNNWYVLNNGIYSEASQAPQATDEIFVVSTADAVSCVSNSNNLIIPAAGNFNSNSINIGPNASVSLGNGSSYNVKGDFINAGNFNAGTGTVVLNGTSLQKIKGLITSTTFNNLTINNSTGVLFEKSVVVNGVLTLTSGRISLGSNNLTLGTSATVSGTLSSSNMIVASGTGELRKQFSAGTYNPASFTFPVGTSNGTNKYNPVMLDFVSGTFGASAYVGVRVQDQKNPLLHSDNTTYVNKTWIVEPNNDVSNFNYNIKLYFNPATIAQGGDFVSTSGQTIGDLIPVKYSGGQWYQPIDGTFSNSLAQGTAGAIITDFLTWDGLSTFSQFGGVGSSNNPLPVELISFNGTCNEGMVNLLWQTASEFNSSHFDVEKSTDGETWRVLATIPSAGTSNELLTYQTVDNNGTNGANYYRLRQVDIDGKEKLYDPINVSCAETTAGYFTSYPNPSGNEFQVVVNNKEILGACTLNILDVHGKVIDHRSIDMKDGINMFVINETLNPGIYFLNITNGIKSTQVIKHAVK